METGVPEEKPASQGLSSEKREDIWALLIAALVLGAAMAFPEAIHEFFKSVLYLF